MPHSARALPGCARTATRSAERAASVAPVHDPGAAATRGPAPATGAVDDAAGRTVHDRRRRRSLGHSRGRRARARDRDGRARSGRRLGVSGRLWPRLQPGGRDFAVKRRHRRPRRLNRDRGSERRGYLRARARLRGHAQRERERERQGRRSDRKQPANPRARVVMWCLCFQCGCPPTRCRCHGDSPRRRNGCSPSRCSRSPTSDRRGCARPSSESRGCWSWLPPIPL
jgi:hypothetical protein